MNFFKGFVFNHDSILLWVGKNGKLLGDISPLLLGSYWELWTSVVFQVRRFTYDFLQVEFWTCLYFIWMNWKKCSLVLNIGLCCFWILKSTIPFWLWMISNVSFDSYMRFLEALKDFDIWAVHMLLTYK